MERKKGNTVFDWDRKNTTKTVLFTDWEGPWVLNDFAYELCLAIFNNDRFFRNLSEYDDYLFYVAKKEGYEAGYTLKLLTPFISASGAGNKIIEKLINSAVFLSDAKIAAGEILQYFEPVVVSTAYKRFVVETAKKIGFNIAYGSEIDFSMEIDEAIREELLRSVDIIASLRGLELFEYLNNLISKLWDRLLGLKVIGAKEKAEILEIYEQNNPIVIGDSITDCKMFEKAKELGGIAIAFNGNKYALEKADVAVVSSTALGISSVVITLLREKMNVNALKRIEYPKNTKVFIMNDSDFESVLKKSMRMRVKLRGSAGSLG